MDQLFSGGGGRTTETLVGILVVVAIMALRFSRPRPLKPELLWVRPAIFVVIIASTLISAPPDPSLLNILILLTGAAVGAAAGWQRGRFMRIAVDPDSHDLTARASPLGMVFIIALLGVRVALRGAVMQPGAMPGLSPAALTDGLIVLVGAMMSVQNLEMWLRARRLLSDAQAARTTLAGGHVAIDHATAPDAAIKTLGDGIRHPTV
jgi:hypothetical protein